jgi:L-alanine-DL-glutamate epimerase-like enolase superfamily enzyme
MLRALNVAHESWALATPFRISRGVKTIADVVVVEIHETNAGTGGSGRGEAVPYARYGETVDSVLEQVRGMKSALAAGLTREALQQAMPPGAARNAIDCALWDLSATLSGRSVTAQLGHGPLPSLPAMLTIGIDTPEAMHAAAERLRDAPMIKVKLDANDPAARLRAVRAGAPQARLVVDANEGWTFDILKAMQPTLADARVELIEQPLPAKADAVLEGFDPACPICADESCHVADNARDVWLHGLHFPRHCARVPYRPSCRFRRSRRPRLAQTGPRGRPARRKRSARAACRCVVGRTHRIDALIRGRTP